MTTYTGCTILSHKVEFKTLHSGYISVGCDEVLIGNYTTARQAVFAATEHVRVVENLRTRPSMPEAAWVAVESLAAAAASA